MTPTPSRVHLIGSLGAHLELLERVASYLEADCWQITWVTSPGAKADALSEAGETVRLVQRLDRQSVDIRKVLGIARVAFRERPEVVITSGAGLAVPFCLAARALGARIVYVELMARVVSASATGRALSPFCDAVLVQWPEMAKVYKKAEICRPLLLDGVRQVGDSEGVGTFVTLGSHDQAFTRLLHSANAAAAAGILPAPVTVQVGQTPPLPNAVVEQLAYVSPTDFQQRVASARLVVSHGGDGAMSTALRAGKRPLVMPRRAGLGEHVDDHQAELVEKFKSLGLIEVVEGDITSAGVRATYERATVPEQLKAFPSVGDTVVRAVHDIQSR